MKKERVSVFSKDYRKIKALQKRAFPAAEQYPFFILMLMAMKKGVDYYAYYDKDTLCGITYTSATHEMLYVLYIAVNDEMRSMGYGSKILSDLKKSYPDKIITLNIEPLDENADNFDQRQKRISFYFRNGYRDTGYCMVDTSGTYSILSTAGMFSASDFKKVISKIGMDMYKPRIFKAE